MKSVLTFASLSLLGLGAASAFAQDTGSWSGPYVGIHVGGMLDPDDSSAERFLFDTNLDGNYSDTVFTAAAADAFSPGSCSAAANGATPAAGCRGNSGGPDRGLRAGYDWQQGQWVFGIVGEYSRGELRDAVTSFSTTPAFYTMTRELDETWALRGRIGFAFGANDDNLFYATAGVARARIENAFTTSNGVNTFTPNGNDDVSGGQWGLGYEHRITDQVTLGLEYLAARFEDDGYRVRASGPAPATNPFILANAAGTDFRRSDRFLEPESLRVTVGWRF